MTARAKKTLGRVMAATRITYGHFYVAPETDGSFTVFDDRNPDGRARLADDLTLEDAIEYAHEVYTDEGFGQR